MEHEVDPEWVANLAANSPTTWWQDQRVCRLFARYFAKYILALDVACRIKGRPKWESLTGFLVSHRGIHVWFTAAHVLDALGRLAESRSCEVLHAWWFDGCEIQGAERIPVDLESLEKRCATCQTDVLDVGFVVLNNNERDLLVAGAKHEFATERGWRSLDTAKPVGYYLVGFPADWQELRTICETSQGTLVQPRRELACVPVRNIDKDPQEEPNSFWAPAACLFGEALPYSATDELFLNSIKGTSGGPLFSVEVTGPESSVYRLHGVQSAWLPERRIVRAVRMDVAARVLDHLANSFREPEHSD